MGSLQAPRQVGWSEPATLCASKGELTGGGFLGGRRTLGGLGCCAVGLLGGRGERWELGLMVGGWASTLSISGSLKLGVWPSDFPGRPGGAPPSVLDSPGRGAMPSPRPEADPCPAPSPCADFPPTPLRQPLPPTVLQPLGPS